MSRKIFFGAVFMKNAVFFTGLLFAFCFGLAAQTLDLEQARVLALANSRSLASYELAIRSSILDERNQLFSMLPQISAGYSASMSYFRNWEFINPIDTLNLSADISITQIIFQGGKNFVQRAINKIATESVRIDAHAEYFNVLDTLDNAYYAALEAAASLEAEESSLQTAVLGLSMAQIRYESGIINLGDYLRAQADKEARENSRNQAARNLTLSMNRLRSLTGITAPVQLEQINFDMYENLLQRLAGISDEQAGVLYDQFRVLLTAANPSLARAVLNNRRAELNLSSAVRDYAPTISATIFATGLNYSPRGTGSSGVQLANGLSTTSSAGISIRGSIPVDFWVLSNRVERNRIARDTTLLSYANTENSLEQELQSSLFNLFTQAGSVLSSRRSLEYTQRHFEYVFERYRLLQSSVSELNEASGLLINSRNSLNRASYSFLRSLSGLRSLCALDDEDHLIGLLLGVN